MQRSLRLLLLSISLALIIAALSPKMWNWFYAGSAVGPQKKDDPDSDKVNSANASSNRLRETPKQSPASNELLELSSGPTPPVGQIQGSPTTDWILFAEDNRSDTAIGRQLRFPAAVVGTAHPAIDLSPGLPDSRGPTPWPTAAQTPFSTLAPYSVNGITSAEFVVMNPPTRRHVRDIYVWGQSLGRDPRTVSKIGTSILATDQFLVRLMSEDVDLGPFHELQPVLENFGDSFVRSGVGTRRGLSSWAVLDPARSDKKLCLPSENLLDCEFRLNNPSVLIISLGTNDIEPAAEFEQNMRQIVESTIEEGVIPILTTKADRFEGKDDRNNTVTRKIAADYQVPLWDFDLVASTLPGRGMGYDNVHLTYLSVFDYNQPASLQRGYGLVNLTALMVLDEVWWEMKQAAD